ncbi:hypothetical protein FN846DRAFT_940250 [Sphaerosporella brunnea]|uniref:Glycoside hydrolase superfamily n=1 Tax=Sphaerosporella brunnea TaxID=1250544 RepID=A0A5J5F350_9PEZI|nr:hypothetical protein FN846DRAFT_940250 [Sphaerosporella brunnea]
MSRPGGIWGSRALCMHAVCTSTYPEIASLSHLSVCRILGSPQRLGARMKLPHRVSALLVAAAHVWARTASAIDYPDNTPPKNVDVWCGKAYRATDVPFTGLVDKGWLYPPPHSDVPRLAFTCRARLKPFVKGTDARKASIVVDARISHDVGTPFPHARPVESIYVTVSVSSLQLVNTQMRLGDQVEIAVDLDKLPPRTEPYSLTCHAAASDSGPQFATASSELYWLPPSPYNGSIVQLDTSTGELVVSGNIAPGLPGANREPFFPIGYYTGWGNYLESNFGILSEIKKAGFTLVHPIPGGGSANEAWGQGGLQRFGQFLDAALEAGVWVMYDMRHTYSSSADLKMQIRAFRDHPALLLWYTADEPDGHNDPTNSTYLAYKSINALDGYHPVSFTPNCQNYFFEQYASGADIVVPDIYPVGNNVTFSTVYNTPCNRTYGCCGCDNCLGTLHDLATRIEEMKEFTRWMGTHKIFWGVSQAFGASEFWSRVPTHDEMVDMSRSAIAAGAKGMLYWASPTTDEIWKATSEIAKGMNSQTAGKWVVQEREVRTEL